MDAASARSHLHSHVVVRGDGCVFDYHGFSEWSRYWRHVVRRANQWWPGWSADIVNIGMDALVPRRQAREYQGLWNERVAGIPYSTLYVLQC